MLNTSGNNLQSTILHCFLLHVPSLSIFIKSKRTKYMAPPKHIYLIMLSGYENFKIKRICLFSFFQLTCWAFYSLDINKIITSELSTLGGECLSKFPTLTEELPMNNKQFLFIREPWITESAISRAITRDHLDKSSSLGLYSKTWVITRRNLSYTYKNYQSRSCQKLFPQQSISTRYFCCLEKLA